MSIAMQFDLFGGLTPPADLGPVEKAGHLMEVDPETRGNDFLLTVRWWEAFDALRYHIGDEATDKLLELARMGPECPLTNTETIRRRRQEHQRLRDGGGHLLPDRGTIAYRKSRDGAGPPRRGR